MLDLAVLLVLPDVASAGWCLPTTTRHSPLGIDKQNIICGGVICVCEEIGSKSASASLAIYSSLGGLQHPRRSIVCLLGVPPTPVIACHSLLKTANANPRLLVVVPVPSVSL